MASGLSRDLQLWCRLSQGSGSEDQEESFQAEGIANGKPLG